MYPSLYEGFGLPPLEAMAAGIPVIAMPYHPSRKPPATPRSFPTVLPHTIWRR